MGHSSDRQRLDRAADALRSIGDPLQRLDAVRDARESLEALEAEAVRDARRAGVTWKAIGALYGTSKQGAQQRFRHVPTAEPTAQSSESPGSSGST